MKILVATGILFTSLISSAAESKLYDLMYLPSARTSFGISNLGVVYGRSKVSRLEVIRSGLQFTQTLGHSLSDRLAVTANLNYVNQKYKFNFSGFSDDSFQRRGLSDPSLGLRFRLLENDLLLDFVGGAVIKTGNEESTNNAINNKQGTHSFKGGLQLGTKAEDFQWAILVQLDHFIRNDNEDAHNSISLQGDILTKISSQMFLRFFVLSRHSLAYHDDDGDETSYTNMYDLGPELLFSLSEKLLLKTGLTYNTVANISGTDNDTWQLNVGANYQF